MHEFAYKICDPATDPDAIAKCAEARIIVGVEGSGLFNALFAPTGSAIVVIAPDGFHPLPYMQTIAGAAGLELFLLGAHRVAEDKPCELDLGELRAALRTVTAS